MNVMAGAERIRSAAEAQPRACREFFWGKRLAAVQVDLEQADAELLEDLLDHAAGQGPGAPAARHGVGASRPAEI